MITVEVTERTDVLENLIVAVPTTFKDGTTKWEAFPVEAPACIANGDESEDAIQRCREIIPAYREKLEELGMEWGGGFNRYGPQTETLSS